jgi:hypothetical protein
LSLHEVLKSLVHRIFEFLKLSEMWHFVVNVIRIRFRIEMNWITCIFKFVTLINYDSTLPRHYLFGMIHHIVIPQSVGDVNHFNIAMLDMVRSRFVGLSWTVHFAPILSNTGPGRSVSLSPWACACPVARVPQGQQVAFITGVQRNGNSRSSYAAILSLKCPQASLSRMSPLLLSISTETERDCGGRTPGQGLSLLGTSFWDSTRFLGKSAALLFE